MAQYALGGLCEKGNELNFGEAFRIYTLLSEKYFCHPLVQYLAIRRLAIFNETGCGVKQNDAEAARLYELAFNKFKDLNYHAQYAAESLYALGILYEKEKVTGRGFIDAAKVYTGATRPDAWFGPGRWTTIHDNTWTRTADNQWVVSQGHDYAKHRLANMHKKYQKSATNGDPQAQYVLGKLYEHGYGVPQNLTEAERYFRLAAAQNHLQARCNVEVNGRIDYTQIIINLTDIWKIILAQTGNGVEPRLVCKAFCSMFDGTITSISLNETILNKLGGIEGFRPPKRQGLFSNLTELCLDGLEFDTGYPDPVIKKESDMDGILAAIDDLKINKLSFPNEMSFVKKLYKHLERITTLTSLKIVDIKDTIPDECQMLSHYLTKNTTLTSLSLYGYPDYEHFSRGLVGALSFALPVNKTIKTLQIKFDNNCPISNVDTISIIESIKDHISLTSLRISCIIEENYLYERADMWINRLSEYLKNNTNLIRLNIKNSDVDNAGIEFLINSLRCNTTLTALDLSDRYNDGDVPHDVLEEMDSLLERNKKIKKGF